MKAIRTLILSAVAFVVGSAHAVITEYPSSITISASGGSGSATAIVGYTVPQSRLRASIGSSSSWLNASLGSISSAKAKTGNDADWYFPLSVSAGANPYLSKRDGSVTVWFWDSNLGKSYHSEVTYYVYQNANTATVDPSSITVSSVAGTASVNVTTASGVIWDITSNCSWIEIPNESHSGSGTATVTIQQNANSSARVGSITVAGKTVTIQQQGQVISTLSYTNLRGSTHDNPSTYVEGSTLSLDPANDIPGYTFSGWSPSEITSAMSGPQTINATWEPNQFTVRYLPNGGVGEMVNQTMTYDLPSSLADNQFSKDGYSFAGWSTNESDLILFDNAAVVSNLTTQANGTVDLKAVWQIINPDNPIISPASGTLISGTTLSVSISCSFENATIHYTTDGSDPTDSSPVYARFKISSKTLVKAIAILPNGAKSGIISAEYARGVCECPTIVPNDNTVFEHSNQPVRIINNGTEGVLRYTLDGSDPSPNSDIYTGEFTISETTVVKAKVFSDSFFDSAVICATLKRNWLKVNTPVIDAPKSFSGSKTLVSITCPLQGATIRYTTNGSIPTSHSPKYSSPFNLTEGCIVKAIAVKADYLTSDVATLEISKEWCIGDSMGKPDHRFLTSGDMPFVRDTTIVANGEAMRSGALGNSSQMLMYKKSTLSTTVNGPGTIHFSWKASCEQDDDYEWDHGEFAIDGVTIDKINGLTDWISCSYKVLGVGTHIITWTYLKDNEEKAGDDCIWVRSYAWDSDELYTHGTKAKVPYAWINKHFPQTIDEYESYEEIVKERAANQAYTIEDAFVAGINPTDETAEFKATIAITNGVPYVIWNPNLNTNGEARLYKVWGRENLQDDFHWEYPTNSLHRFFKVTVEMP